MKAEAARMEAIGSAGELLGIMDGDIGGEGGFGGVNGWAESADFGGQVGLVGRLGRGGGAASQDENGEAEE